MVFKGANEGEGACDVIIGNDKRQVQLVVHIARYVAKGLLDPRVGPSFKRPPQIDADQLSKNPGIDALKIVGWQCQVYSAAA